MHPQVSDSRGCSQPKSSESQIVGLNADRVLAFSAGARPSLPL